MARKAEWTVIGWPSPTECAAGAFARVIVVDFSASSTVGPARPSADRCWLAWADVGLTGRVSAPEYFGTRRVLELRLIELIGGCPGRVLLAVDFPLVYPVAGSGAPVMPVGRELTSLMHGLVRDEPDGANNRFEVAGELNRRIRLRTGAAAGPFWAHPAGREYADVSFRKPGAEQTGVKEYRASDLVLRARGWGIQSAWKLAGVGSVGGQAILGLAMVERVARAIEPRVVAVAESGGGAQVTDAAASRDGVVVCEVWPSLCGEAIDEVDHPIRDARQVVACCGALISPARRGGA